MAAEPSLKCGTCEFNRVSRRGWQWCNQMGATKTPQKC